MNRRNNSENSWALLTELVGPNDYTVPVMKVVSAKGKLKAIAFDYAFHSTVLYDYKESGDYPRFTHLELEKHHWGAMIRFCQNALNKVLRFNFKNWKILLNGS